MNTRCRCATVLLFALLSWPLAAGGLSELATGSLLTATEEWGIERLDVNAGYFDVEYRGGAGPVTRVEVFGTADERVLIERDAELLTIRSEERALLPGTSRGRIAVSGPVVIDLSINAEGGSVSINTVAAPDVAVYGGAGSITVERVEARLSLYSSTGDISVVGSSGTKRITSDAGDVVVRNSDGDLTVRTTAGRVNMWDVEGALDVETVSGAIDIVGVMLREKGRVVTNSGRIEVVFTQDLEELDLDVSTVSGNILIEDRYGGIDRGYAPPIQAEEEESEGLPLRIPFSGYSVSGHQYYR